MECSIQNLTLHYEQLGQGEDVLMLHGWGSSLDAFHFLASHIAQRYRVTLLDFPGFGRSDMPPEPWDVEQYTALTAAFITAVGLNTPILVGHSFGGRVITKLCGTGRCDAPKIILLDAAGVRHKPSLRTKCRTRLFKLCRWFLQLKPWAKDCEPALQKLREHFGSADYNSAPSVLRQTLVKVVNEDLTHHMPNIQASTLLIYGENDTATPVADAKLMESLIPDAGLCIIPGAGHWAFVEKPGHVLAIISSFLSLS